ncbi:hypothetical protein [Aureibacter tunicatorum]|uniref:Uncharacterized protein n=1 Tax=Aureibacter tunicatorum TaxID=866807 RepID=A0AAE4BVC0_9BACT|nr:hypothetical protein [Aureibacter tunicatorum]MDR6241737.1 hypothetical protein [Aureibacter tunicatorum]BDD07401.1 hypothetical protein AUTU_48840 [Aureibacter tunicatorum]
MGQSFFTKPIRFLFFMSCIVLTVFFISSCDKDEEMGAPPSSIDYQEYINEIDLKEAWESSVPKVEGTGAFLFQILEVRNDKGEAIGGTFLIDQNHGVVSLKEGNHLAPGTYNVDVMVSNIAGEYTKANAISLKIRTPETIALALTPRETTLFIDEKTKLPMMDEWIPVSLDKTDGAIITTSPEEMITLNEEGSWVPFADKTYEEGELKIVFTGTKDKYYEATDTLTINVIVASGPEIVITGEGTLWTDSDKQALTDKVKGMQIVAVNYSTLKLVDEEGNDHPAFELVVQDYGLEPIYIKPKSGVALSKESYTFKIQSLDEEIVEAETEGVISVKTTKFILSGEVEKLELDENGIALASKLDAIKVDALAAPEGIEAIVSDNRFEFVDNAINIKQSTVFSDQESIQLTVEIKYNGKTIASQTVKEFIAVKEAALSVSGTAKVIINGISNEALSGVLGDLSIKYANAEKLELIDEKGLFKLSADNSSVELINPNTALTELSYPLTLKLYKIETDADPVITENISVLVEKTSLSITGNGTVTTTEEDVPKNSEVAGLNFTMSHYEDQVEYLVTSVNPQSDFNFIDGKLQVSASTISEGEYTIHIEAKLNGSTIASSTAQVTVRQEAPGGDEVLIFQSTMNMEPFQYTFKEGGTPSSIGEFDTYTLDEVNAIKGNTYWFETKDVETDGPLNSGEKRGMSIVISAAGRDLASPNASIHAIVSPTIDLGSKTTMKVAIDAYYSKLINNFDADGNDDYQWMKVLFVPDNEYAQVKDNLSESDISNWVSSGYEVKRFIGGQKQDLGEGPVSMDARFDGETLEKNVNSSQMRVVMVIENTRDQNGNSGANRFNTGEISLSKLEVYGK